MLVASTELYTYEGALSCGLLFKVVPMVQRAGITVWGVWDTDSWLNTASAPDWPLLFDTNFQAKPALQEFANGLTGMCNRHPDNPLRICLLEGLSGHLISIE